MAADKKNPIDAIPARPNGPVHHEARLQWSDLMDSLTRDVAPDHRPPLPKWLQE